MRIRTVRLFTLLLLTLLPAINAFTAGPEIVDNYYVDSNYNGTAVGWGDRECDGSYQTDGTLTSYRYHEIFNCGTGNRTSATCQTFDSGSGTWVAVECPDEAVTFGGKIRVPIG